MNEVEITNERGNVFQVRARNNEFVIEPSSDRLSPGETLLASLGSCIGLYARRYLDNAGISCPGFSLKVSSDFTKEPPYRFSRINVSLDLKGAQLEAGRKEAFMRFIENCPIHNTLNNLPVISIELK